MKYQWGVFPEAKALLVTECLKRRFFGGQFTFSEFGRAIFNGFNQEFE